MHLVTVPSTNHPASKHFFQKSRRTLEQNLRGSFLVSIVSLTRDLRKSRWATLFKSELL